MTQYNDIQAENKRKYKESITRQCKVRAAAACAPNWLAGWHSPV